MHNKVKKDFQFFGFKNKYINKISNNIKHLTKLNILDDSSRLIELCENHFVKLRKLSRILEKKVIFDHLDQDRVEKINKD